MKPYIIKRPIVTEKSLALANEHNTYVFEVARTARKNQIKAAVEELFDVTVVAVRTAMSQQSRKRTGRKRLPSVVPKHKKALVQLKEGDTISVFDVTHA